MSLHGLRIFDRGCHQRYLYERGRRSAGSRPGIALRQDHLEKAEQMAEKAVKNNPDNNTFLDTYAWVLFMREKYKEAKKVMEKAINSGNVSAIHYEHYGDILYKLGNVDLAVEQWQKAKGLNPNRELIDKKIADRKLYEQ